jgi:hypothetical protein
MAGILLFVIGLGGCVEHRYYRTHHEHSDRYYQHHPRRHVDVDINVHPR